MVSGDMPARYFGAFLWLVGLVSAISTIAALLKGHAVYFFTAAGYVGFVGLLLGLIASVPIESIRSKTDDNEVISVLVGVGLAAVCLLLFPLDSEETDSFNFLSGIGVVLLVGAFFYGVSEYGRWQKGREPARKACPDCANEVLAAAKVCEHCNYRFEPAAQT